MNDTDTTLPRTHQMALDYWRYMDLYQAARFASDWKAAAKWGDELDQQLREITRLGYTI